MIDDPPREITPTIRRRAWAEPHVRSWWLVAGVLLVLGVSLAIEQYTAWSRIHRAVATGTTVQAKVIHTVEFGQRKFSSNTPMVIDYDYNGQHYEVIGTLEGLDRYVSEGDLVPLHIDPTDPANWTARSQTISLSAALVGPILVLPIAVVAGFVALFARSSVIKTYRTGRLAMLTVVANRLTPLAPFSRSIGCSIAQGERVVEVIVPQSAGPLAAGDPIKVILPLQSGRPLAVAWFGEGT